jgi:hypothetical protein
VFRDWKMIISRHRHSLLFWTVGRKYRYEQRAINYIRRTRCITMTKDITAEYSCPERTFIQQRDSYFSPRPVVTHFQRVVQGNLQRVSLPAILQQPINVDSLLLLLRFYWLCWRRKSSIYRILPFPLFFLRVMDLLLSRIHQATIVGFLQP